MHRLNRRLAFGWIAAVAEKCRPALKRQRVRVRQSWSNGKRWETSVAALFVRQRQNRGSAPCPRPGVPTGRDTGSRHMSVQRVPVPRVRNQRPDVRRGNTCTGGETVNGTRLAGITVPPRSMHAG